MTIVYYIQDILQRFGDWCTSLGDKTLGDFLLSLELPINIPVVSDLWSSALNGLNSFLSRYGANDYPLLFGLLSLGLLGLLTFALLRFVISLVRG